ncbi:hypothetical protein ACFOLJ_08295 [Rugamonas sp. CCM 8940]|uniref:hypothetical protein n=1 Tax=Rugamonas sp. CCM 8940 TaxID=2765359 RepID=UPI0018F7A449|nr:hypothetical protein [Rugamonas sp. CCM 8940]MBJ7309926.1 hypothetical protein [Rugamonas sp. CCM 8940]
MSIKTIEPDANTPDGMLLAAAEALYGCLEDLMPEAKVIARGLIDGVLAAAGAQRFPQVDILATLLARCEITQRTAVMARSACEAAGSAALRQLYERVGLMANTLH